MGTTKLPGGLTVRTFQPPPTGWDPDKASDRERTLFGYPRCPVEFPDLVSRWTRKLRDKPYKFIEPQFKPRVSRRKSLPRFPKEHGTQTSGNWAGAYVTPPEGTTFKWVESSWRFPQSYLPGGAQDNVEYFASTWIGIDGVNGSGDILQAGCDSDISTSGRAPQHQYNPWWEWWPAGSFWITNLTFSPGDEISLLICATQGDSASGAVFFSNNTTNTGGFFHATAPAGTNLLGDSAEWIVEALESQDGFTLAKFDTVDFTDCNAGTVNGKTVTSTAGQLIDMINSSNSVIADSSLIGSTEVQVKYTGS
jgi:hypothetical protein